MLENTMNYKAKTNKVDNVYTDAVIIISVLIF